MSGFSFVGALPSSKSLFNRALLVQSFAPHLRLVGHSQADDVEAMRRALQQMKSHLPIDCGSAGTVLRFMALRAAREPGRHHLYGSKRLFERPQQELNKILSQLGCEVELTEEHLKLRSWGWKMVGDA
ncbi:MAG: 3-phosphoshikimate 1-carboxyvinyltransferase, partial [Bdellovibrionales bacterium]